MENSQTVEEVCAWLEKIGIEQSKIHDFRKEEIDGATLFDLTEDDMKNDLNLTLGQRKKIIRERSSFGSSQKQKIQNNIQKNVQPEPIQPIYEDGYVPPLTLVKGELGEPQQLTEQELNRIKYQEYDIISETWKNRQEPLNQEELDCWIYQASWLVCPISGKHWRSEDAIMGVGLYHAPRFLSPLEQQRNTEMQLLAYSRKSAIKKEEKLIENDQEEDQDSWQKDFEVYPSVEPPPQENFERLENLPDNVTLGHMEVIHCFDVRSYNWGIRGHSKRGIKSKKERGVLSMDQQWNALNFQFYVPRTQDSFERKYCTNRLSFYIDGSHGKKIFPSNIESQLSLLVYRDKRVTRGVETDQILLAKCIRKAIPAILKATVREIIYRDRRVEAIPEKYRKAYEELYRTIMLWIQNPFLENSEWQDLEEILIGSSLVGISWNLMREAFMRKLMVHLVRQTKLKKNQTTHQKIDIIWKMNSEFLQRILYEFSFFVASGKTVLEQDRIYDRCAGSLPKKDRQQIQDTILLVEKVDNFTQFWTRLGNSEFDYDQDEINSHIFTFFEHTISQVENWEKKGKNENLNIANINVPKLGENISPLGKQKYIDTESRSILAFNSEREKELKEKEAIERKKHRGYPPTKQGNLDRLVCAYCNLKFNCRDHLFRHLNKMIEPERMIKDRHAAHRTLKVNINKVGKVCQLQSCKEIFNTEKELEDHYTMLGVKGFGSYFPEKKFEEIIPEIQFEKQIDQFEDPNSCVICLDSPRSTVNVPCGHLITCSDCGILQKECAVCRAEIASVINVFYS